MAKDRLSREQQRVAGTTTCVQVWDAASGTTLWSAESLERGSDGSISTRPILDSSGRFVAFLSNASGLVTNALPGAWHVYLRDLRLLRNTRGADPTGDGSLLTGVIRAQPERRLALRPFRKRRMARWSRAIANTRLMCSFETSWRARTSSSPHTSKLAFTHSERP